MHTVIRVYNDATALFDELANRESDVREIISGVPGFVRYGLVRSETGGFSITTCESKEGTDESVSRAAAWIKENLPDATGTVPMIIEGDTLFYFEGAPTPA